MCTFLNESRPSVQACISIHPEASGSTRSLRCTFSLKRHLGLTVNKIPGRTRRKLGSAQSTLQAKSVYQNKAETGRIQRMSNNSTAGAHYYITIHGNILMLWPSVMDPTSTSTTTQLTSRFLMLACFVSLIFAGEH